MADSESMFYKMVERRRKIGRLDAQRQFLKWRKDAESVKDSPEDVLGNEIEADIPTVLEQKNQELSKIGETLDEINPEEIEEDGDYDKAQKKAVYREVKREHEMADIAPEIEKDIEELETRLDEAWAESDSFEEVKNKFQQLVERKRDYAEKVMEESEREFDEPYEVFFSQFEPHLELEHADSVLKQLRQDLTDLIDRVNPDQFNVEKSFDQILPVEETDKDQNLDFQKNLLYQLGLDPEKTPIANASHGLEGGYRYSTPTLVDVNKLLPLATKTSIHEGGHQEYRQGLGKSDDTKYLFTPLGEPASHLIDESLARFWENHIGRSEEFSEFIGSEIKEHFELDEQNEQTIAEAFHAELNSLNTDNLNRLQADEATYHLHILTRYDIERELINGNIEADDIPEVWQDKMNDYLGVAPSDDEVVREENGIMQDPHWFRGKFGYFPQYTLGTMLSAQLDSAMREDFEEREELDNIDQEIEDGNYKPMKDWLDENIHQYGKQYPTSELIEQATGEELNPEHLFEYLEEKYVEED